MISSALVTKWLGMMYVLGDEEKINSAPTTTRKQQYRYYWDGSDELRTKLVASSRRRADGHSLIQCIVVKTSEDW